MASIKKKLNHNSKREFNRFAKNYLNQNYLQISVAKHLLSFLDTPCESVLDLGCGGGVVYSNMPFSIKEFIGIDSSTQMCNMHPKSEKVKIICKDFDSLSLLDTIDGKEMDLIVSSSSMQWSKNMDRLVQNMTHVSKDILISVFTNATFSNLHNALGVASPLYSKEQTIRIIRKYFFIEKKEIKEYSLNFNSTKELLFFIKKTGISGGKKVSKMKDIFSIIEKNTIKTLTFEVLFIKAILL